jgi:hypothetical protein
MNRFRIHLSILYIGSWYILKVKYNNKEIKKGGGKKIEKDLMC